MGESRVAPTIYNRLFSFELFVPDFMESYLRFWYVAFMERKVFLRR